MNRTRTIMRALSVLLLLGLAAPTLVADEAPRAKFVWGKLPPLPDKHGFAGGFAGLSHDALVFAGGANFPDAPPWKDGKKVWCDSIFVLAKRNGQWKKLKQTLPQPLAYGASVTHNNRLICIGGDNGVEASKEVFAIEWKDGRIAIEKLPPLPQPCTGMCAGLIDGKVYVAGGLDRLEKDCELALKTFWVLDLDDTPSGWKELAPWPGPERFQAVPAVIGGQFYLLSGIAMETGPDGKPRRRVPLLKDAYRYTPAKFGVPDKWERISDLPRAVAAAAAPAPIIGERHFLVVGGVDNNAIKLAQGDLSKHPGFATGCLAYHTITDTWTPMGEFPDTSSRVCAPAVKWGQDWIVLSGEVRPGVRSPRIISVRTEHDSRGFGALDWTVLAVYLGLLVAMGFYFSRREETTKDFFLGGKRIPWWAVGLSIYGTQLSSISYVTGPAKVFNVGWLYYVSVLCITAVAPLIVFSFLRFYRRLDVTSAYEYLEKRFGLGIRLFGSLSFMIFQLGRITVVLFIPALALSAVTGLDIYLCIVIMGVLATIYTALGGIEAVVWTDVIQVVVLLGAAVLCLGIIVFRTDGGLSGLLSQANAADQFRLADLRWDITEPVLWVMIVGSLFHNIVSYGADQAVVQRYLTTPDEKSAAKAIWTNAIMVLPGTALMFLVGTGLFIYFRNQPQLLSPALKNDQIFPHFASLTLPPGVVGLFIAGIFAATMSTLDSSLNSIATAFVTDFHRRFKPDASERSCLRLARGITIGVGILAILVAFVTAANQDKIQSLWDYYFKVIGLLMGCITGVFMLGIFTRRATAAGAWLGVLGGGAILVYAAFFTRIHGLMYAAIGIIATFAVGYVASLVLPAPSGDLSGLTMYTQQPQDRQE